MSLSADLVVTLPTIVTTRMKSHRIKKQAHSDRVQYFPLDSCTKGGKVKMNKVM